MTLRGFLNTRTPFNVCVKGTMSFSGTYLIERVFDDADAFKISDSAQIIGLVEPSQYGLKITSFFHVPGFNIEGFARWENIAIVNPNIDSVTYPDDDINYIRHNES